MAGAQAWTVIKDFIVKQMIKDPIEGIAGRGHPLVAARGHRCLRAAPRSWACMAVPTTWGRMFWTHSGICKIKGAGDVLARRIEQGVVKPGEEVILELEG